MHFMCNPHQLGEVLCTLVVVAESLMSLLSPWLTAGLAHALEARALRSSGPRFNPLSYSVVSQVFCPYIGSFRAVFC